MKGSPPKSKNAKSPNPLAGLRAEIDGIDSQLLRLLNQRAKAAVSIGHLKAKANLELHAPEREQEIFDRLSKLNRDQRGTFPTEAIRPVFREIISASLSLEKPLRVGYLGPKATFTHLATIEHFGLSAENLPLRSIRDVFEEVQHRRVDYGVVPIENSTEGMVNHTLDLFVDSSLRIIAEEILEVEHNLLLRRGQSLGSVRTIVSHGQALAQCRNWLEKHLPGVPVIEAESTAQAAQMAVDDPSVAAIASRLAADLYGLTVVGERIQDQVGNVTRFLVLGHSETSPSGADKTSILFSVRDQPGALFKMLKPFAESGVNLTKIESRPRKSKAWEYVFFIDLDGHIREPRVSKAVADLEKLCVFMKILGSYPRASFQAPRVPEKAIKEERTKGKTKGKKRS